MNIQIYSTAFAGVITPKIQAPTCKNVLPQTPVTDVFERTTFDLTKDLKKIKLAEKINSGVNADVYKTNFDGYVVRLLRGNEFKPNELKIMDDPNGLIVAANDSDTMRLMKFVKGEPLYGGGWKVLPSISKEDYMKYFNMISNLPDETFAEYIQNIIKIRNNGYNIDIFNPNNYLLHNNHIGIVDLEKQKVHYKLALEDFNPLIDEVHLLNVLSEMDYDEITEFAKKIRTFYDKIIRIAKEEGQYIGEPMLFPGTVHMDNAVSYLYYNKLSDLDYLINYWKH